jgi:hypothetical protein
VVTVKFSVYPEHQMTRASDAEVAIAIRQSRSRNPGIGVEKLVRLLHERHPSWAYSVDVSAHSIPDEERLLRFYRSNECADFVKPSEGTPALTPHDTHAPNLSRETHSTPWTSSCSSTASAQEMTQKLPHAPHN